MSLSVVAHITALADKVEEAKALLTSLTGPTRQEAGCIRYELHQNNENPRDLTFIEEWESEADLEAHLKTPHIRAAFEKMPEVVAGSPDIRKYRLVG